MPSTGRVLGMVRCKAGDGVSGRQEYDSLREQECGRGIPGFGRIFVHGLNTALGTLVGSSRKEVEPARSAGAAILPRADTLHPYPPS